MTKIIQRTFKLLFTYLGVLYIYINLDPNTDFILIYLLFIFPFLIETFDRLETNKNNPFLFYFYIMCIIVNSLSFVLSVMVLSNLKLVTEFRHFIIFSICINVFSLIVEFGVSVYKYRKTN